MIAAARRRSPWPAGGRRLRPRCAKLLAAPQRRRRHRHADRRHRIDPRRRRALDPVRRDRPARRAFGELWTPRTLERLARTYWRFLTRATLGLVRVEYTDAERYVVSSGGPSPC